jgi:alcohol dehydrogenase (NADP+)
MKYLEFSNKDKMPMLGLGTYKSGKGEVYNAVCEAIKIGYRHIDCAPIYGNEPEIGKAIKDCISEGLIKREELWITSKLWNSNHGRQNVLPAIKKTLSDLNLDYLDLYLIHWPVALVAGTGFPTKAEQFIDPDQLPLEETWKGMEDVLEMGLARHIGVSNFNIQKIENLLNNCNYPPEVNQVEMHPLNQQKKLVDFCNWHNIKLTAYAPLGAKDPKKIIKTPGEPDLMDEPIILDFSERYHTTPAQILLAWSLTRNVSTIPKSVNKDRLLQNFKAADLVIKPEDMEKIASMERNYRFINGKLWTIPGSPHTLEDLWGDEV